MLVQPLRLRPVHWLPLVQLHPSFWHANLLSRLRQLLRVNVAGEWHRVRVQQTVLEVRGNDQQEDAHLIVVALFLAAELPLDGACQELKVQLKNLLILIKK